MNEDRDAAFEKAHNNALIRNANLGELTLAMISQNKPLLRDSWNQGWQAATEAQRERDAKIAEAAEPKDQLEELSWNRGH